MKKTLVCFLLSLACIPSAFAATDYVVREQVERIISGELPIYDLKVENTSDVGGALDVGGTLDVAGVATAASFSGALAEGDIVYNSGSASACSYTGTVTDIDSVYLNGPPLLALVITDAVATATFNIASVPGVGNMARPFTIVNTSTSTVTLGHNSLVYPAADITMGQYGTVTISGLYTNMWLVTVDNTP